MTDTWQNSPAVTYPPTNPAPSPLAPPSPLDRAVAGVESAGAREQATGREMQSTLAPRYAALSQTLAQPIPQPPQQQPVAPAPKPEDFSKLSMAFVGAMAVLGAVSSRYTRNSGGAALAAFTGALQGWQKGSLDAYNNSAKEWEQNTKATIENNNHILAQYKQVLENRRLNIDQQMSQIQLIAAQYQDKMMLDAAAAKNYTMVAQIYGKQYEFGLKAKEAADKLQEKRDEQTKKAEQTAAYWLSPEGVQRRAMLTPEQNAGIDKMIQVYGSKGQGTQTPEKVALQRYLEEHPDATGEEIQKFRNRGKQPRSAAGMALSKYLDENPNATAEDIQKFQARQAGLSAEERTGAVRAANIDIIMRNAHAAIPMAIEASKNVPRTTWVPINKLVQTAESQISDPSLKEFRLANLQLAELWARAMNPSGIMRESDRSLALDMLSTADSQGTYERVAHQLENFLQRERKSVQEFRQHQEPGQPFNPTAPSPTAGGWKVEKIN